MTPVAISSSSTSARASADDSSSRSTAWRSASPSSPSTYAVHFGSFGLMRGIPMISSSRVRADAVADGAHRGMKEKANVADGKAGDVADVPIAQAALKSQVDDLALVARKRVENVEHVVQRLTQVVAGVEIAIHGDFSAGKRRAPVRLLPRVDGEVPAHREQPRRHVIGDTARVLAAQAQERLLHD